MIASVHQRWHKFRRTSLIFIRIVAITPHGKRKGGFQIVRLADDDWKILAECLGSEPRQITGLKSKIDADDWLDGDRRIAWLRSQG